ncbi:malonic semialdehyde reductase [bacterium]|nr:malonic semialdehyde reductase [bacterium]MDA9352149.1 malonic semialdehyde reductase [Ascidiaceihabitans sp.]
MGGLVGQELEDARARAQDDHRALRSRISRLSDDAIDLILRDARSHYAWTDKPIADGVLEELYDITCNGPTSMNTLPARFVFVKTAEGKDRLAKSLKPANVGKMMGAPITVIVAHDMDFWKQLNVLFPHEDRRHMFDGKPEYCADTAYRNGTMQGTYMMLAARALGLDVGAMSGFSNAIVDEEFFAGTMLKSNFLLNIGYGDESALFQKLPRLSFEQACNIA